MSCRVGIFVRNQQTSFANTQTSDLKKKRTPLKNKIVFSENSSDHKKKGLRIISTSLLIPAISKKSLRSKANLTFRRLRVMPKKKVFCYLERPHFSRVKDLRSRTQYSFQSQNEIQLYCLVYQKRNVAQFRTQFSQKL